MIAAGIVALSAGSFLISADGARDAVKAQIRAVTGLDPVLRGPVEVSLFPSGTVSLADVVLGEDQGQTPPLAAERLVAHLRFLPLLIGRIEIADIALDRPHIAVQIDADGRSNWSPLLATLARALDAGRPHRVRSRRSASTAGPSRCATPSATSSKT